MEIKPSDLKIDTLWYGSNWSPKATGVRIEHIPSGIYAEAKEDRSQYRNRDIAYNLLLEKLKSWDGNVKPSEIESLRTQIAELKQRLEINEDGWDGIACRDETIKVQDVKIAELKAENERLKTTPAHKREDLRCVASDLAHQCRGVESERDEFKARYERLKPRHEAYVKMIGELLAVLHADGGHYQYEHGTEKAVEDVITKHYELTRQLAEVKDKIAELQEQVDLQIPAGVMAQQMKLIAELRGTAEYETKMRAITYARIDSQELKINELDALLEYSKQHTREAEAERDELKVQLAEYKADAAPEGYVFLSADFSRQAAGHSQFGTVTFIRNKVGRQWWHELPEEQQEITSLHIYGKGTTVIEAMRHAAMEGAAE